MKFYLQYHIKNDDGNIIEKKSFNGEKDAIVPCLETMIDCINSRITYYDKLFEEIWPQTQKEIEQMMDDVLAGKPMSKKLKDFLNLISKCPEGSDSKTG